MVSLVSIFYRSALNCFQLCYVLSFGGIVRLLSSTHHLILSRSCYFLAYPFNRSVVFSFKFFHLIKFCLSFQPECCLKSFLPIMPFFQQFRRQCVVDFIKYHPIFSSSCSIPSIFNRSAARILPLSSCLNRSGFEFYLVH